MDDNPPPQLSFEDNTGKNMFDFVCNHKETFHFPYQLIKKSHIWVNTVFRNVCHIQVLPRLQTGYFLNQLATGWTVWGSNPGGGKIFHTHPDRAWGPPSLLHSGYQISFSGLKWPRHGVDHPPLASAEVKERVELYLYSPSGPSWPVLG
jgi:hypothetical protein